MSKIVKSETVTSCVFAFLLVSVYLKFCFWGQLSLERFGYIVIIVALLFIALLTHQCIQSKYSGPKNNISVSMKQVRLSPFSRSRARFELIKFIWYGDFYLILPYFLCILIWSESPLNTCNLFCDSVSVITDLLFDQNNMNKIRIQSLENLFYLPLLLFVLSAFLMNKIAYISMVLILNQNFWLFRMTTKATITTHFTFHHFEKKKIRLKHFIKFLITIFQQIYHIAFKTMCITVKWKRNTGVSFDFPLIFKSLLNVLFLFVFSTNHLKCCLIELRRKFCRVSIC